MNSISALRYIIIAVFMMAFSACQHPIFENDKWEKVGGGLNFPEGPVWDGEKTLYFSNCSGGWIGKISAGKIDTFLIAGERTFRKTNGLAIDKNGDILACDFGLGAILKISAEGAVTTLIAGFEGTAFNRPNDIRFTTAGNFYFTDPKSYGENKLDGRLFYYESGTKTIKLAADSLAFPNGLAISPVDKKLYVSESAKNQIIRFDIDANGELSNKQTFIKLPGGDPDGLDFDSEGNLYVAHFGSGTLFVISPDGRIKEALNTSGKKSSNLEFGGQDLKTLFLTEDETNAVYKIRTNFPGYNRE
ncbi:MAG: SMP-30/gluconolactonase/LRE family protein [Calditrichaeota bacterium]|nr:MAG: SMP-30/gluconolactonase/LRE family protein [Calditrichota bacterium]